MIGIALLSAAAAVLSAGCDDTAKPPAGAVGNGDAGELTIAAVGDINLDSAVTPAARGPRYPWGDVRQVLGRVDLAVGNLECAISRRGSPVLDEFNFRGDPAALRAAHDFGGIDVVSLANNHTANYGPEALRDTLAYAHRFGLTAVGAGGNLREALAPGVVEAAGLRVAFVGFSAVTPPGSPAGSRSPGIAPATEGMVRSAVRDAKPDADLVIALFHWGEEGHTEPNEEQRALADAAFDAGATAVIGSHPHVLQPVERVGRRRLVAWSLGNFVFSSSGPSAILKLRLSARGVEGHRVIPVDLVDGRPTLAG